MYDRNQNDMELEEIQTNEETRTISQKEYTTTPYDSKPTPKTLQTSSNIKLTGNLPKDIVNLMSINLNITKYHLLVSNEY